MSGLTLSGVGLLVVLAGAVAAFVIGLRGERPLIIDLVRSMNRRFINPRQLKSAGTAGAYASVIVHRGRISGRRHETPVGAVPIGDGFAIALVYGRRTDWVQNVLAAGEAEIVHEGVTYRVDNPEVVAVAAVSKYFSPADRRGQRVFGVTHCMVVRAQVPPTGNPQAN